MIKSHQLPKYDAAANKIEQAATILESVDVSGIEATDLKWLTETIVEVRRMRHEFHRKAHERFLAERAGDVKPGE